MKRCSLIVVIVLLLFTVACAPIMQEAKLPRVEDYFTETVKYEPTELKVGLVAGPYGDMYSDAIAPTLEELGYSYELIYYNDYSEPNLALANGEIDLNIFQNYIYLNNSKFDYDIALSALVEIPTASMGIYSSKITSLLDVKVGHNVSIPNDSANLARALTVLENSGLIKLTSSLNRSSVTLSDITENPFLLKFVLLDAHLLANSLSEYDFSVINGNYAIAAGLKLSSALYNESLRANYFNVIAVRTEDLSCDFVQNILNAVKGDFFSSCVTAAGSPYEDFHLPFGFNKGGAK